METLFATDPSDGHEVAVSAPEPKFKVGSKVIDGDGFKGTVTKVTVWEGSTWFDVRFESGSEAVRYTNDLKLIPEPAAVQSANAVADRLADLIGYPPESVNGIPMAHRKGKPKPIERGPLEWAPLWDTMKGSGDPVETTAEMFYEMLGAVPPFAQSGSGFLTGEWSHYNAAGVHVAAAFWRDDRSGKYFAQYMTLEQFKNRKAV